MRMTTVHRPAAPVLAALLTAFAWLALPAAAAQDATQKAADHVERLGDRAIDELADASVPQDERAARFRTLLNDGFDVPAIARFVLGRYWRVASPQEREAFMDTFERVLVQRFLPLFEDYRGDDFKVDSARQDPNNPDFYVVDTLVRAPGGNERVRVQWRVRQSDGELEIVDVTAEGVSMAITLRSEYSSVIQRHGGQVSALVDLLDQKLAEGAFRPQSARDITQ